MQRAGFGGLGTAGTRGGIPMTPGGTAAVGAVLQHDVKVADRPVTQQGIMGMKQGGAGPGRKVADKSYFLGLVNKKVHDIVAEMQRLEQEKETIASDKVQFAKLETKYGKLIAEVRNLEGQLADFNLAMDKMRTSADPSEITQYRHMLADQNRSNSERTDRVLEMRQELERELASIQQQTAQVAKEAEARVDTLAPEQADRFRAMQREHQELLAQMLSARQEAEQLGAHRRMLEDRISGAGSYTEQCAQLSRQVARAMREKAALQQELGATRLDPDEARELMLTKVKQDKAKLDELDAQLNQVADENRQHQRTLTELSAEVEDRQREESKGAEKEDKKAQTYEVLHAREKEMSAFIDAFPEKRQAAIAQKQEAQERIVALLEHISEGLQRENAMPSRERVRGMRDDLQFKEKQLESAEATKDRLEAERDKCLAELQKINTLDQKIQVELKSLGEKMSNMRDEMEEFTDIPALREAAERTREDLESKRASYKQRRDNISGQVQQLSAKYEGKKKALAENETAKTLEGLEQKLRHYEQNIFHLREVVAEKEHECNYHTIKDDCTRMLDELNAKLIKDVESQPIKPTTTF